MYNQMHAQHTNVLPGVLNNACDVFLRHLVPSLPKEKEKEKKRKKKEIWSPKKTSVRELKFQPATCSKTTFKI